MTIDLDVESIKSNLSLLRMKLSKLGRLVFEKERKGVGFWPFRLTLGPFVVLHCLVMMCIFVVFFVLCSIVLCYFWVDSSLQSYPIVVVSCMFLQMILDASRKRSKMNKLESIENVSHSILRGRCNTILRVSLLATCLACMVLLVYYLPEIVTGEGALDDARGLCRDGPCESLWEGGYLTPGEKIKEAKVVCRRAAFCALARSGETLMMVGGKWGDAHSSDSSFEEVRDICRDVHCAGIVMRDAEKVQFITLEVGSALIQIFNEEKAAMDAAIVEGDELRNLAGGFHKGPVLQLIGGQLNGNSITHIHWEVLDAVFRRGNDTTSWNDTQIRQVLLLTRRWSEEKLKASSKDRVSQQGWIVSNMLDLLELRISDSEPLATISTCQDSCEWNGICEDGGISAATFDCDFGTDCMVRMSSF